MKFEVELGGITSAWTYPGSVKFQNWLNERRWLTSGGLCIVRIEPAACDIAFKSIRSAAHAVHCDDGEFCVKLIPCGGSAGTPQSALMHHFQLNGSPVEAAESLRLSLRKARQLLVFFEQDPVDVDEWERFIALSEHLSKSTKAIPLAIVILDGRSVLSQEPTCDFQAGHADLQTFSGSTAFSDDEIWARYVYMRSWWDAGGCLEHATALWKRCSIVNPGDDEGLEAVLQSYAQDAVSGHPAWSNLKSSHGIVSSAQAPTQSALEIEVDLLDARFLWRPPGLQSLRVVPLAARALLAERLLPDSFRWSLRSALVCSPLAAECLNLCQFFETQIRSRLHGRGDPNKLPSDVNDRQRKFQDGSTEYIRYPTRHPSPPQRLQDLLAFASFGEALSSCPPGAVSDADRSVQYFRNSLAHGHYVTWWHCKLTLTQLRRLDIKLVFKSS